MRKHHRYVCLGVVSLLGLSITGFSAVRLNASVRHPDGVDKLISQSYQEDGIGNRRNAIALTHRAADILLKNAGDCDARARLAGCALQLSEYGERREATALLSRIKGYHDPAGEQAAKFYSQITHDDRAWRTAPIPDAATIVFRKAILKHRPASTL